MERAPIDEAWALADPLFNKGTAFTREERGFATRRRPDDLRAAAERAMYWPTY